MNWSRLKLPALLVGSAIFFLLCHERHVFGEDEGNFVLAMKYGYSIAELRPHAPGYPGFYLLWKGLQTLLSLGPHATILLANAAFAIAAIALTFIGCRRLFGERTAWIAAILVATNPLLLYFGSTAELYAYDAAFSAFVVILLLVTPRKIETAFYFCFGLLGAFRLSSFILTLPIVAVVLGWRYYQRRDGRALLREVSAIFLGTLCWLVPFLLLIGATPIVEVFSRTTTTYDNTLAQNLARWIPATFWMMNLGLFPAAIMIRPIIRRLRALDERPMVLVLLVLLPALFFALRVNEKGYMLLTLAPFSIVYARMIAVRTPARAFATIAVAVNLLIFFGVPFIPPSVRSTLNHQSRAEDERVQTVFLRSVSWYAPTLAHLHTMDQAGDEADALVIKATTGTFIFVDFSASEWGHARCLSSEHPVPTFLMLGDDTAHLRFFHGDVDNQAFARADIPETANFQLLTTSAFIREIGIPPGRRIGQSGRFVLDSVPIEMREQCFHFEDSLFQR